jgi:hypothetical protein
MKQRKAQYPLLKRGMLYHLKATLGCVIKEIILQMGDYHMGRQAATLKK